MRRPPRRIGCCVSSSRSSERRSRGRPTRSRSARRSSAIEPYLDIQRIRFADWLTIDYQVDDAAVDCLLPRFVLQPLVENAIRHGLSGRSAAGRIEISATVHRGYAHRSRHRQRRRIRWRAGRRLAAGLDSSNVRDRLAILYGDDDRLRLASSESGGAVAELTIPVRRRNHEHRAAIVRRTTITRPS